MDTDFGQTVLSIPAHRAQRVEVVKDLLAQFRHQLQDDAQLSEDNDRQTSGPPDSLGTVLEDLKSRIEADVLPLSRDFPGDEEIECLSSEIIGLLNIHSKFVQENVDKNWLFEGQQSTHNAVQPHAKMLASSLHTPTTSGDDGIIYEMDCPSTTTSETCAESKIRRGE